MTNFQGMTLPELKAAERQMMADIVRLADEIAAVRKVPRGKRSAVVNYVTIRKGAELRQLRLDSWALWSRKISLAKSLGLDPWGV